MCFNDIMFFADSISTKTIFISKFVFHRSEANWRVLNTINTGLSYRPDVQTP